MFNLKGRFCLVTGSSRGIGRAVAIELAAAGAAIAVNYRTNESAAQEVVATIEKMGQATIAIQADTSVTKEVDRMFESVMAAFGRLDVLVNNAGVVSYVDFLELKEEEWDRIIDTNLRGYFLCGQRAARIMVGQRSGSIINISSISQIIPGLKRVHYCVSKGGIHMLTKGMALELAPYNITVNAVAPGATATDFTEDILSDPEKRQAVLRKIPLSRIGRPTDIAGAVLLLASDRGAYMTGQTIYVDGGYLL